MMVFLYKHLIAYAYHKLIMEVLYKKTPGFVKMFGNWEVYNYEEHLRKVPLM